MDTPLQDKAAAKATVQTSPHKIHDLGKIAEDRDIIHKGAAWTA